MMNFDQVSVKWIALNIHRLDPGPLSLGIWQEWPLQQSAQLSDAPSPPGSRIALQSRLNEILGRDSQFFSRLIFCQYLFFARFFGVHESRIRFVFTAFFVVAKTFAFDFTSLFPFFLEITFPLPVPSLSLMLSLAP